MTIHFVYAGLPGDGHIQSPYCITKHLHAYLMARGVVAYHMWDSASVIQLGRDDILLGHPHYDPNTTVQATFRQQLTLPPDQRCRRLYLIHPFHHKRVEDNMPFDWMARAAGKIFSICGPYWYDTVDGTPFAHWKSKMIRLDMAVDAELWPYRKRQFGPPGYRNVVYVGSSMPQKNLGMLTAIAQRMPHVRFEWYGGSGDHPLARLPNVRVEGWQHFTPEKVERICNGNDLFVNVSVSDANPTTLLEFCLASGLIPICTESSGYWRDPCFVNIPMDVDGAVRIIEEWRHKPTEELVAMSQRNRETCERQYTWDRFCATVWEGLQ